MILALETGGNLASLALLEDVHVVAERTFRHQMSLSRDLLPQIDQLLATAEAAWTDISAVAVGLGPGSYTGLRIGLVTAKTLAWTSDRPVLGISSLTALAAPYPAPPDTLLCAVLEARPGEFYTALYQRRDDTLQIRAEPTVLRTEDLASRLTSYPGPVQLAGHAARFTQQAAAGAESTRSGSSIEPSAIQQREPLRSGGGPVASLPMDEEPQARWIGRLAAARLRAGERDHPVGLVPLYVRAPSPTLKPTASALAVLPSEGSHVMTAPEGSCPDSP